MVAMDAEGDLDEPLELAPRPDGRDLQGGHRRLKLTERVGVA
jgi:hypothetical protein